MTRLVFKQILNFKCEVFKNLSSSFCQLAGKARNKEQTSLNSHFLSAAIPPMAVHKISCLTFSSINLTWKKHFAPCQLFTFLSQQSYEKTNINWKTLSLPFPFHQDLQLNFRILWDIWQSFGLYLSLQNN